MPADVDGAPTNTVGGKPKHILFAVDMVLQASVNNPVAQCLH